MKELVQNDLSKKYHKVVILIHWITTVLIIALFLLGKFMVGIEPHEKLGLIKTHAISGMFVFTLTIIRTILYFKAPRPPQIKTGYIWNDKLIPFVHRLFYILLFTISISGVLTMIFGGYINALNLSDASQIKTSAEIIPLKAHELIGWSIVILLFIHVFGIAKHYLLTKENTLKRMS
jgi:cytochrome b561